MKQIFSTDCDIPASEIAVDVGKVFVRKMTALTSEEGFITGLCHRDLLRAELSVAYNALHCECVHESDIVWKEPVHHST